MPPPQIPTPSARPAGQSAVSVALPIHTSVPPPAVAPAIPDSPDRVQLWIDFDGTITAKDVLDELILGFAVDDSWRLIESEWRTGAIGSYDCLRREFDLVRIDDPTLRTFLDKIPIDVGVVPLLELLRARCVPFAILSDGIELFIRSILARVGERDAIIRSNRIEQAGDRLSLRCPHRSAACVSAAAHCKCESAEALTIDDRKWIYVGDGRSDLCPARRCEIVFAKGVLAQLLRNEGKPFIEFETLADVAQTLAAAWANTSSVAAKPAGASAS